MSEREPRLWRCEHCDAVLGIVFYSSKRLATLSVLRDAWMATQLDDANLEKSEIYSVVSLRQGTVICLMCSNSRDWFAGDQDLVELLANRKKRAEVECGNDSDRS